MATKDYNRAYEGTSDGKKEAVTAVEQFIDWNGKKGWSIQCYACCYEVSHVL